MGRCPASEVLCWFAFALPVLGLLAVDYCCNDCFVIPSACYLLVGFMFAFPVIVWCHNRGAKPPVKVVRSDQEDDHETRT